MECCESGKTANSNARVKVSSDVVVHIVADTSVIDAQLDRLTERFATIRREAKELGVTLDTPVELLRLTDKAEVLREGSTR